MLHINKIKTMYGLKWAVTGTSYNFDKKGNKIPYTHAMEYSTKTGGEQVAIFPLTEEGLVKAKEVREFLNKNK